MKRIIIFFFLLGYITSFSQTVIATQSFENSGDTWAPLSFSTPPCTVGNDRWDFSTSLSSITPNDGNQFWGIQDLRGNCGGSSFESITLPNTTISSFSNVVFSFDFYVIRYRNNDDIKYELFYDNASQGEVIIVDGFSNGGNGINSNGWLTETVNIPSSVTNISVIISVRQNDGNTEFAGIDNIKLESIPSPTNNDCSNATTLTVGTNNTQNVITGTNIGATDSGELPQPNCANYVSNDVWYTLQVPSTGTINIQTLNAGSSIDTGITAYTGSCGNLTQIDCDDDSGSDLYSSLNLTSLPNTTIYVRVWAYDNVTSGIFNIVAYDDSPTPPTNNDCLNATNLTVGTDNTQNVVTGTNVNATSSGELPNPSCANYNGNDVWYTANVPASGLLTIETLSAGSSIDTGIAVYTGSCGNLTQIDCDDDTGSNLYSLINLTGLSNTTIYIRVWAYDNVTSGDFNIVAHTSLCPLTTRWNNSGWNNGVPNSFTSAVINSDYDTAINSSFESCDCTINTGITVNIRANNYISVENDLTVTGVLEVRNEGSLVMVNDNGTVTSSGTINVHKTTTPFNQYDYIYWSSPTENETFGSALSSSNPDGIYQFNLQSGWISMGQSDQMTPAKGYLAMGPITGTFPQTQSVIFDGIVNNGVVKTSNFEVLNNNWNLIGNPYPSAIDANLFLDDPLNVPIISGTIYLWTHNTPRSIDNPGDELYNYSANDYATFTSGIGGTAAGGGEIPTGYVASGQGFFIQGIATGEATFNNSMRVTNNNNQFFKSTIAKDRIWLNLFNKKGAFSQILIGFIENATDRIDRYDGPKLGGNYVSFYSIIDELDFAVQGKPSITDEEIIKLGYYSFIDEGDSLKIGINTVEGNLTNFNIYLKDKSLNIIHDLKIDDYSFISEQQGVFNERFELLLTKTQVLGVDENIKVNEHLILINQENSIEVSTSNATNIINIKVYTLLGKSIINVNLHKNNYTINTQNIPKGTVLLISTTLENNHTLNKKFIVH